MAEAPSSDLPSWEELPEPPPRPPWMRWLIPALVGCGLVAVGSLGVVGYLAYRSLGPVARPQPPTTAQPAPATPLAQASFIESARLVEPGDIGALAAGELRRTGMAQIIAAAGGNVVVKDQAGKGIAILRTGLRVRRYRPAPNSPGPPLFLAMATVRTTSVVVAASPTDDAVVAYDVTGVERLRAESAGTRVTALAAADLNGDGESEILVGRDSQMGVTCLNGRGAVVWRFGTVGDPSIIVVADGTGDGKPEVYVGGVLGGGTPVVVLNGSGQQVAAFPQAHWEVQLAGADLDHDGRAEFLALRRTTVSSPTGPGSAPSPVFGAELLGLAADGQLRWRVTLASPLSLPGAAGCLSGDFDGDGRGEWVVANTDGTFMVYDKTGAELGKQAVGQFVTAIAVSPPEKPGGRARLWLAAGSQVIGLDWAQWARRPSSP